MPRPVNDRTFSVAIEKIVLALIISLGVFVQFFRITSYSLGFDEAHSLYLAHLKISKLLLYVAKDTGPPLFYLMLKLWTQLFGDSVLAARSLSATFMILAIPVGFLLVKELFNKRAAYLAALFLAVGPFMVRYGHETRMYGPMAFFTLFATYLLIITLRKRLPSWLGFTAYTLAMIVSVYIHYYSFLILPSHWVLVMVLRNQKITLGNCRRNLRDIGWLSSQVAILLSYLPWLLYALKQFAKVERAYWLPPVQWETLPTTFLNFTVYQTRHGLHYGVLVSFCALLVAVLSLTYVALRRRLLSKQLLLFIVSVIIIGPVLIFIFSLARSIYYDRYFIYAAAFFYMLLGVILAQSYTGLHKLLQVGGIIIVLLLFTVGVVRVDRPQYDNISSLMSAINSESATSNYKVVVIDHRLYYQVAYYNHSNEPTRITRFASLGGYGDMSPVEDNPSLIATRSSFTGTVWVVYYGNGKQLRVPRNWHALNSVSVYFEVQAQEYTIKA